MKALQYSKSTGLQLKEVSKPILGPSEVLIKVKAAAICGSDLRILKGEKRASDRVILGHEVVGVIEEVGSEIEDYLPGECVVVFPSIFCGKCTYCKNGLTNICEVKVSIGYQIDGGFAQYLKIPKELVRKGALVKLSRDIESPAYALVEPFACVIRSCEEVGAQAQGRYLIIGAGPMGLMHMVYLKYLGAEKIFIAEKNPSREKMASRFINDTVVLFNPERDGIFTFLKEESVDGAFLCACAPSLVNEILQVLKKGKALNLFAGCQVKDVALFTLNLIHYGERKLIGTHSTNISYFKKAAKLIESRQIDLSPLITHEFPLEGWKEAFEVYSRAEALKVIFRPN